MGVAQEEVMLFDSQRFLAAQEAVYDQVVEELSQGQKTTHWMWFVFPPAVGALDVAYQGNAVVFGPEVRLGPKLQINCLSHSDSPRLASSATCTGWQFGINPPYSGGHEALP